MSFSHSKALPNPNKPYIIFAKILSGEGKNIESWGKIPCIWL